MGKVVLAESQSLPTSNVKQYFGYPIESLSILVNCALVVFLLSIFFELVE